MAPPQVYEQLINAITERYEGMSKGFQKIARFLVQNPNEAALMSVKVIAEGAGVQPSALVRFAQSFEYSGFSDMQNVFRSRLLTAAPGFNERINALQQELGRKPRPTNLGFLSDLVINDIAALQNMLDTIGEEKLAEAVSLLTEARTIYVLGQLRAFPVASFLRYLLSMLRRDARLLDSAGGLATEEAKNIGPDCVLLAVSFRHYAHEVAAIVREVAARGVPVIAITDSQLSPIAQPATVYFEIPEDEYSFSRSIAAPVCLAHALVLGVAHTLNPDGDAPPRIPMLTELRMTAKPVSTKGRRPT